MKMEKFGLKIECHQMLIDCLVLCGLSKSRQVERAQLVLDKMNNRRFLADISHMRYC